MPHVERSLLVTNAYREQVAQTVGAVGAQVRLAWPRVAAPAGPGGTDLDSGYQDWLTLMVPAVAAAQTRAVQASAGYLTAFLTSEYARPTAGPRLDPAGYAGITRDGRTLPDGFQSPLFAVKAALKRGQPFDRALTVGLNTAIRLVGIEVQHTARASAQDGMVADDRIAGYRRAVRGTCGACLGAAAGTFDAGDDFLVHPNCECYPEPRVRDLIDRFPRPTGPTIFAAMTAREQDQAVGEEAAQLVRDGDLHLADLVHRQSQKRTDDFITQAPDKTLT